MIVINPHSGRGLSKTALGTIISNLCAEDYIVSVFFANEMTPEQLAYEYAGDHDLVVCVGGDGTLSGLISGLMKANVSTPVGFIPAGTTTDIATTLALSRDPSKASKTILSGTPKPLDIGKFHESYFTYIAAFGAFTSVSYTTPQSTKRTLGHFAYVLSGLADMTAIKPVRTIVEYDGNVIEGDYIFGGVTNSTSVAGLVKLNKDRVDLADGLHEIILVKHPVALTDFVDILTSLTAQTYGGDNVQMFHAKNVKFTFEQEVPWTFDGEDGGKHKVAEIVNCHQAVKIVY